MPLVVVVAERGGAARLAAQLRTILSYGAAY
jgi:hypothetical protein